MYKPTHAYIQLNVTIQLYICMHYYCIIIIYHYYCNDMNVLAHVQIIFTLLCVLLSHLVSLSDSQVERNPFVSSFVSKPVTTPNVQD